MTAAPTSSTPAASRRWTARIVAIVVLIVILVVAWTALGKPQEVASFERPDHHYKVVVVRRATWWHAAMPGQAGDAPGLVRLYGRSGSMMQQARVDRVQVVDGVEWQDRRVVIKFVAEWPLPD
ncbi:MAG: hypothetical protein ABJD97_03340 [Betaproteobacteria bacterium]